MRFLTLVVALGLANVIAQEPTRERDVFREVFVWKKMDFIWPHDSDRARALDTSGFQPENCALHAVRAWGGSLLLTLPRWRRGVPVTLATIEAGTPHPAPNLVPFPSWDMQTVGNCSAIQSAQAIDVTPQGRLWVVDGGRAATLDAPLQDACPPKVLIFDLDSRNLSDSRLWKTMLLPPNVLSPAGDSSFADIAIDADDVAYISDAGAGDPGVVVVDARASRVWKARDPTMRGGAAGADLPADIAPPSLPGGVTALALESDAARRGRRLFYAPLRSRAVYALEATALRDEHTATDAAALGARVVALGNKTSATAAMATASGVASPLYLALNAIHSVARWDAARGPLERNLQMLAADSERLQWPSSLALDPTQGNLWVISNRLPNFLTGNVNVDEPNYRVMRAYVGNGSGSAAMPPPPPPPPPQVPITPTEMTTTPTTQRSFNAFDVPNNETHNDRFNYTTHNNNQSMEYDHQHDHAGKAAATTAHASILSLATIVATLVLSRGN